MPEKLHGAYKMLYSESQQIMLIAEECVKLGKPVKEIVGISEDLRRKVSIYLEELGRIE